MLKSYHQVRVDIIFTFRIRSGSQLCADGGQIILLLSFQVTTQRYFGRSEISNFDLVYRLEVIFSLNSSQFPLQLSYSIQKLILEGRSPNSQIRQS